MKTLYKKNSYFILSLLLAILISFLLTTVLTHIPPVYQPSQLAADSGVIHLKDFDSATPLSGEWEFYPNVFLFENDFVRSGESKDGYQPEIVSVPGAITDDVFGTYRLRIRHNTNTDSIYTGIYLFGITGATRVYLDGVEIISSGNTSTLEQDHTSLLFADFQVTTLNPLYEYHNLIVQVSMHDYRLGGITAPIYFGSYSQLNKLQLRNQILGIASIIVVLLLLCFLAFLVKIKITIPHGTQVIVFSASLLVYMVIKSFLFLLIMPNIIPAIFGNVISSLILFLLTLSILYYAATLRAVVKKKSVLLFIFVSIIAFILLMIILAAMQFPFIEQIEWFISFTIYFIALFIVISNSRNGYTKIAPHITIIVSSGLIFLSTELFEAGVLNWTVSTVFIMLSALALVTTQVILLAKQIENTYNANKILVDRLSLQAKVKDEFLVTTSHELRTPLHGITNLVKQVQTHPSEADRQLPLVLELSKKLGVIVNDLINYIKFEDDHMQVNCKMIDSTKVATDVLNVFRSTESDRPIDIINRIPPKLPKVYADEHRLWQIFNNFIGNAFKYTQRGQIVLKARHTKDFVYFSISDTGVGICDSDCDKIFDPYWRKASAEVESSGLGLYITRQLLQSMDGDAKLVSSKINVGSKFEFYLPTAPVKDTTESFLPKYDLPPLSNCISSFSSIDGANILLADDDPVNLSILCNIFANENVTLDTATNSQEVIDIVQENRYDVAVLDLAMPGISGIELCKKLRQRFTLYELPIIILTAHGEADSIMQSFDAGANDYITKPVDMLEVKSRVNMLVALKRSVDLCLTQEIAFLQAQIKPHFLFNAMNAIGTLCLIDGEKASELTDMLSLYLRTSFDFDSTDDFTTISKELDLTTAYLAIEKARFGDKLNTKIDIHCDKGIKIPRLTIQPIVENAVRHGVTAKRSGGLVTLTVNAKDNELIINVTDDGIGFDVRSVTDAARGVGLKNIANRLKMYYNREIDIKSTIGEGTSVTINIPI